MATGPGVGRGAHSTMHIWRRGWGEVGELTGWKHQAHALWPCREVTCLFPFSKGKDRHRESEEHGQGLTECPVQLCWGSHQGLWT